MISGRCRVRGFRIDTSFSVQLSGSTRGRIRKLSGFRKHHHIPDTVNDATCAFVRQIGHEDVRARADSLYSDLREAFGYKRKAFDYTWDAGVAEIKTPDFDALLRVDQCRDAPKDYVLTTQLRTLHNEEIARSPALHACFNPHCEELIVSFPKAIELESKIDAIEDNEALAGYLSYAPDSRCFELKLPDLDLHIMVDPWTVRFRLLALRNLGKLIDHSQRAFEILTACGFELRLSAED
ncbi:MAG: hypothetical protein ACPG3X_04540 [Opitutales bacterium]